MIKNFVYTPKFVCSSSMSFTFDDETMTLIEFNVIGGCNGNLKGIKSLIEGMKIADVIAKLEGIQCGRKPTSCPDQIAQALKSIVQD